MGFIKPVENCILVTFEFMAVNVATLLVFFPVSLANIIYGIFVIVMYLPIICS